MVWRRSRMECVGASWGTWSGTAERREASLMVATAGDCGDGALGVARWCFTNEAGAGRMAEERVIPIRGVHLPISAHTLEIAAASGTLPWHAAHSHSPALVRVAVPRGVPRPHPRTRRKNVRRCQPRGAVPPPGPPRPGGAARRRAERARSGQGVLCPTTLVCPGAPCTLHARPGQPTHATQRCTRGVSHQQGRWRVACVVRELPGRTLVDTFGGAQSWGCPLSDTTEPRLRHSCATVVAAGWSPVCATPLRLSATPRLRVCGVWTSVVGRT